MRSVIVALFSELAATVGIDTGSMSLTVNDSVVVKIEAFQAEYAYCIEKRSKTWTVVGNSQPISLAKAPAFVQEHLEKLIVSYIGPHGHMVSHWVAGKHHSLDTHQPSVPKAKGPCSHPACQTVCGCSACIDAIAQAVIDRLRGDQSLGAHPDTLA